MDHLLDNYADSLGLPVSLTRSLEEREQLRAARAEALRAAALTDTLKQGADLVKQLAQSPLTDPQGRQGTVLDGLVNLLGRAAQAQVDGIGGIGGIGGATETGPIGGIGGIGGQAAASPPPTAHNMEEARRDTPQETP